MLKFLAETVDITYNGPKALNTDSGELRNILMIFFSVLGAISLFVLIFAGIRFSTSRGNPDAVAKLRQTVIYAAIGLGVAFSAGTLVQFVIKNV